MRKVHGSTTKKRAKTLGFLSLTFLAILTACSINIPTLKNDAGNAANKIGDKFDDIKEDVAEKFDKERHDLIDPDNGLSRDDIKSMMVSKAPPVIQDTPSDPVLPDVSSLLIEPRAPLVGQDKLVSISVTEDIPLKDVILELARRADVDVELDPGISGGIIFRAKDKPFSEVIERISELSGLRYSVKNGVLKVERDTPFVVNYRVDILNMIRSNNSSVNVNTSVLSAGGSDGGGGGGSFNSGSNTQVSTSYEGNVWQEIETTINNIIGNYSGKVTTYAESNGAATADSGTDDILAGATPTSGAASATQVGDASSVLALNKHSGVVTILATSRQHREIKQYLEQVIASQSAQVLIEAKILEVSLTDEYRSGVDWNSITYGHSNTARNKAFGDFTTPFSDSGVDSVLSVGLLPKLNFGENDLDLDMTVQLMEKFGVVKTLSNPRITAMNNQQAVLTFAENQVYFEVDVQSDETGTGTTTESQITVDSNAKTVPIGVILTLQPSIDMQKGEITMNIRPTLSRVTGVVEDPAVAISLAIANNNLSDPISASSEYPIVEVREIDSVLRIKSGQIMVIGGLIEERTENEDKGVPGISKVPYVGNLFKSVEKTKSVVETVIFIKATVVPGFGVEQVDKDFYRTFSTDRRPLAF